MKLKISKTTSLCKHLLLSFTLLSLAQSAYAAVTWNTINPHIQFLKQQDDLRFYDSNQVLIEGDKCALLVDTSANFAAVEQLAEDLKKRLKTPLCYLVATHYHDDHLLGMAVMQSFFPDAKLIVHQQVNTNFNQYQKAYTDKLDTYEKSIELSYQRLASVAKEEQDQWRSKLELAKSRLFRWQEYQLNEPQITINAPKKINLGGFEIMINPHQAHTNGDLTISTNNATVLIGGDIVDWLPYPGHGELEKWQILLEQYINDENLSVIIPGHGGVLTKEQLKQPLSFLTTITEHVKNNDGQTIEQLMQSFPESVIKPYKQEALNIKSSNFFLQAGLNRAKKQ
ncbi:MBL fold metallo-hydrolase [Pseudoalteromonas carrageenovora]|uniref:MBL fold metallo-hydrolase n=1 Tax=Pseudoalteromonas TaxID=53246 RepID=UPI0026E2AFE2|nr:MBL fold metallo-hydrolase [Pseudoalteromonas carrageenovora]MDO6636304.1 MBL fold metallo-hydrolase [Pseudoalteromonas carrageenovora]MDO6648837.1 MBL fold metallo-hydrolase [Pseudoalteromonas carrageenovora]